MSGNEGQGTVLDAFGRMLRDLRISVTDRCNFRCRYCMPAEIYGERYRFLPRSELLTFEEVTRLTRIFVRLGVTKVRLTGGEPLLRTDLDRLVAMLAKVPGVEDLTLTTNGFLLAQQARALKDAGLSRITVSLDTLDDAIFGQMNGRNIGTGPVLEGIRAAETVGLRPIKINAVVQRGVNDHTIVNLARHFRGTGHIVRFIEFMDVGNRNGWRMDQVVPAAEIFERVNAVFPIEPVPPSYPGEVAERFCYRDGGGEIGIIGSVTRPFCRACTRARLSTEGKLFTCLFADQGFDLRGPLRAAAGDGEIEALVRRVWGAREDRYSEARASLPEPQRSRRKVEMYQIGG
ncbi:MAG: GTP 3',8-cyclase MoaA [Chloroflexi bacterium]|nr:GTP 3',8-cyclase MoaA [Chloroflexota bacterium]